MNKREYLQKKGEIPPDLGVLHVVNSTRAGVTLTEEPIWDVKPVKTTRFVDDQSVVVEGKKYSLKSAPYEITIFDDMKYAQEDGYGTGVGDLWSHSYFATLDKSVAAKLFEDEKLRVSVKYQLIF
jgi:hypothetical protein